MVGIGEIVGGKNNVGRERIRVTVEIEQRAKLCIVKGVIMHKSPQTVSEQMQTWEDMR